MLKPTIHAANFYYRGVKSRSDVSGLLTSARYDFSRCLDKAEDLAERQEAIMDYFVTGDDQGLGLEYRPEAGLPENQNLTSAMARCEELRLKAVRLLYGG